MFEAIRDANLHHENSTWAAPSSTNAATAAAGGAATNTTVAFIPGNGERLARALARAGIPAAPPTNGESSGILLIDASSLSNNASSVREAASKVLASGGHVWFWNITATSAPAVGELVGGEVIAQPRGASSFVVTKPNPLTAHLDNAALYFSEGDDWRQSSFGLTGSFVQEGQTLLEECTADWRQWNYKAEPVKTAALFRSEVERTNARAILIEHQLKNGQVVLCNLNPEIHSPKKESVLERLFRNEGVTPAALAEQSEFLDPDGRLIRALVCGSFGMSDPKEGYARQLPEGEISAGARFNKHRWQVNDASSDGVFDFKNGTLQGPDENAYVYLAVWIKSPKPLNDLLSEPNLPRLALTYGSDDGCQLWLNGELLASNEREGPLDPQMFSQNPLLLKLGWNQLVIKVVQGTGEWKFSGKLSCSEKSFIDKLEFATTKPE
jgi:beta-galactosidase